MIVTFHWKIPTESLCDPMRVTKKRNFKLKERGLLHNGKYVFFISD